jgi:transposase-like protein
MLCRCAVTLVESCPCGLVSRGSRFPPAVIMVAVRWYLRYGLSYRDVKELLAERGIAVDHVPSTAGCGGSPLC